MTALGTVIRDAREAWGTTRAQLADGSAVSQVLLSKIEQGTRRPSATKLASIARALRLETSGLLARAALLDVASPEEDDVRRRIIRVAAARRELSALVEAMSAEDCTAAMAVLRHAMLAVPHDPDGSRTAEPDS